MDIPNTQKQIQESATMPVCYASVEGGGSPVWGFGYDILKNQSCQYIFLGEFPKPLIGDNVTSGGMDVITSSVRLKRE